MSGARLRLRPRSWSTSAARPIIRGSWPRWIPTPMPTRARCCDRRTRLIVVLDQVQDPHNLGAVCRSAEFAGAAGVIIPERRAATVTAAVCKASAGAVEHLDVAHVRNLADWLAEAKEAGLLDLGRRRRSEAGALGNRSQRPDRPRPRRRGQGNPPPRSRGLRRSRRPTAARPHRLSQRLRGCSRALGRGPTPANLSDPAWIARHDAHAAAVAIRFARTSVRG